MAAEDELWRKMCVLYRAIPGSMGNGGVNFVRDGCPDEKASQIHLPKRCWKERKNRKIEAEAERGNFERGSVIFWGALRRRKDPKNTDHVTDLSCLSNPERLFLNAWNLLFFGEYGKELGVIGGYSVEIAQKTTKKGFQKLDWHEKPRFPK